jgi:hypothetical protein
MNFEQIYKQALKEDTEMNSVKRELYLSYGRQIDSFDLSDENIKKITQPIEGDKNTLIAIIALSWLKDCLK